MSNCYGTALSPLKNRGERNYMTRPKTHLYNERKHIEIIDQKMLSDRLNLYVEVDIGKNSWNDTLDSQRSF